jgi:hypothetical protein
VQGIPVLNAEGYGTHFSRIASRRSLVKRIAKHRYYDALQIFIDQGSMPWRLKSSTPNASPDRFRPIWSH